MNETATLIWRHEDGSETRFALEAARISVGRRSDAQVRLSDPLVSHTHACIERRGDTYVVRDLGSTNFTRVNDQIVDECELRDGDEIRFARTSCTFVRAQTPAPAGPH
jgi:pSer/pThr/pTyr-binding forkhead associated (FHA) protein